MNAYQLLKAIGDIDDNLILEINQYDKSHSKKRTGIILGVSLAACAMICVISYHALNHAKPDIKEIPSISIGEYTTAAEVKDKAEINEGYNLFNVKLGGTLKQVSREIWSEHFSDDIFITNENTGYFLSYSDEGEVLYGTITIKLNDNTPIDIIVGTNVMTDSGYTELKKTDINGISMAICSLDEVPESEEPQYLSIYQNSENIYTISAGDLKSDDFISALKEIVKPA